MKLENRKKKIKESMMILKEEINELKSRKRKLTDSEKAVVLKLGEISKVLGYRLEEDLPVALCYKERELDNMKELLSS